MFHQLPTELQEKIFWYALQPHPVLIYFKWMIEQYEVEGERHCSFADYAFDIIDTNWGDL